MSVTMQEILMGRASYASLPKEYQQNLMDLLERVNRIRNAYGKSMIVSSGYRTPEINDATANSGKNSWHMKCAAVDFSDKDGKLFKWCLTNLQLFKDTGLWLEDKRWTPSWTHMQIYAPKSKKRIFIPSTKPPIASDLWDGNYSKEFDV